MDLLSSSSDDDETKTDPKFTISSSYAGKYDEWRRKEELQKLKDRYGEAAVATAEGHGDVSSDDASTSTEDEIADQWTTKLDKDFLVTLAALKSKDPRIYDDSNRFFDDTSLTAPTTSNMEASSSKASTKKEKSSSKQEPMYLKDYERKVILEKDGKFSDDEGSDNNLNEERTRCNSPSYVEKQQLIKASIKAAVEATNGDDDELLTQRQKSEGELRREEQDYLAWLKGAGEADMNEEEKKKLDSLRQLWTDPNIDENEKVLRDFVLNQRLNQDDEEVHIPTYNEIVEELDEEDELVDKQENFERKYNFRYEEPDQEFIKSFPRTMKDTLRRPEEKRKEKRMQYKDRKMQEKKEKQDELKQLRTAKKKAIMSKIEKLKSISGCDDLHIDVNDLEKDFDPQEYDSKMKALFNDDYYEKHNGEADGGEMEKPVFSDDSDADGAHLADDGDTTEHDWDQWVVNTARDGHQQQTQTNDKTNIDDGRMTTQQRRKLKMDKVLETQQSSLKKSKKESQLAQALSRKKPVFDPSEKTFEQYFEEYYQLHYEDIIGGDTPCRFKYRSVAANDFGLDVAEVFAADDKELNQWASLKKVAQYRTDKEEEFDVRAYQKKAQNVAKKQKLLKSMYAMAETSEVTDEQPDTADAAEVDVATLTNGVAASAGKKRRRRKKKHGRPQAQDTAAVEETPAQSPNTFSKPKKAVVAGDTGQTRTQSPTALIKPKKAVVAGETTVSKEVRQELPSETSGGERKRKRKQKLEIGETKRKKEKEGLDAISDERLKAYGLNPKKFRNKQKYKQSV